MSDVAIPNAEHREIAVRALLEVAGDSAVRPNLRIQAARSVLFGREELDAYRQQFEAEEPEPQPDQTTDDLIDQIADRAAERVVNALRGES